MRGTIVMIAVILPLLFSGAAIAQEPPGSPIPGQGRDAKAPKTETARLSGRVTALDTGKPLRQVLVQATSADIAHSSSMWTDADGRWALTGLPAGSYALTASKAGYVQLRYGQRRPFAPGANVTVAEGQTVEKLDFQLPRGGVISGRVVDDGGEPVANVRVNALRYQFVNGQRRLAPTGVTGSTDDLGQYRLFGLSPGDYYLMASAPSAGFMANPQNQSGYSQTYYPDARSPAQATRLTLAVGQQLHEVVVTLMPTRLHTISGTARDASGQPVAQGMGWLREVGPGGRSTPFTVQKGKWSASGVLPGEYSLSLQAIGTSFDELAATGSTIGVAREFTEMPLTVAGDISELTLTTSSAATMTGKIIFKDAAIPKEAVSKIMVTARDPQGGPIAAARVTPDATFEIGGLTGTRVFRTTTVPDGWALESVTLNGQDISDTPTPIRLATHTTGLELTFTSQLAELSGTVETAKGSRPSEYAVVLFSNDSSQWGPHSRRVAVAHPDSTGGFQLRRLLPGSYRAVALEWIEEGQETDPEFLERLRKLAIQFELASGEKKTLTLKISGE